MNLIGKCFRFANRTYIVLTNDCKSQPPLPGVYEYESFGPQGFNPETEPYPDDYDANRVVVKSLTGWDGEYEIFPRKLVIKRIRRWNRIPTL